MTSPASLVIVGMLGIALLRGDSISTLGIAKPVIFREQAPCSQPHQMGAFSLQPITGLEAAQQQVSWCEHSFFWPKFSICTGKIKEAHQALKKVLNGTRHALWPHGLADDRQRAQELIREYTGGKDYVS